MSHTISEFSGLKIMVVDDNRDAADGVSMLLRTVGCIPTAFYLGEEALRAAPLLRPHIVFLDLNLPDMDGYTVAKKLRAAWSPRHLSIIAMTGWGQESDKLRTANAGLDAHLVKPVSIECLFEAIRQFAPPLDCRQW